MAQGCAESDDVQLCLVYAYLSSGLRLSNSGLSGHFRGGTFSAVGGERLVVWLRDALNLMVCNCVWCIHILPQDLVCLIPGFRGTFGEVHFQQSEASNCGEDYGSNGVV